MLLNQTQAGKDKEPLAKLRYLYLPAELSMHVDHNEAFVGDYLVMIQVFNRTNGRNSRAIHDMSANVEYKQ